MTAVDFKLQDVIRNTHQASEQIGRELENIDSLVSHISFIKSQSDIYGYKEKDLSDVFKSVKNMGNNVKSALKKHEDLKNSISKIPVDVIHQDSCIVLYSRGNTSFWIRRESASTI